METVQERLLQFIEYKDISKYSFEKQSGLSKRYVSNMKNSIQPDKMQKISIAFPDLNFDWLLLGRGSMLYDFALQIQDGGQIGTIQNKTIENLSAVILKQQTKIESLESEIAILTGKKQQSA